MKAILVTLLSILPMQNLLREARQHYMNFQNDSCAVKVYEVRDYCSLHQGEDGVMELNAEVENILGALSQVSGERDSAAMHYRSAYDCIMRTEERGKASTYCINLADNLRQTGRAPEAALWLRRALVLSDSLCTHSLDCAIYTQLGQIYSDLCNSSMSESYFEMAAGCCEQGSFDDYFLANARGNACFFDERYEQAIGYFVHAMALARGMDNEFRVRIPELNIGECYLSLHQPDSARHYIDSAYAFWTGTEYCDESIMTAIRGMKAGLALECGNIAEADRWLAYGDGGVNASPIYRYSFNRHMMEISVLKGDWRRAYEYGQKILHYRDSLSRSTMESNFAEAEMRFSRDTTVLHQELRIAEQRARISRMGSYIAVSILALIACMIIIRRIQVSRMDEARRTREIIDRLKLENVKAECAERKIAVDESRGERYAAIGEMVLFSYQADTRKWRVLLKDGSNAMMKREYNAERILGISPSFARLTTGSIVNMDFIQRIGAKDHTCVLKEPFDNITLTFSRRSARNVRSTD